MSSRWSRFVDRVGRVGRADDIGIVAEFEEPAALVAAMWKLREEGFDRIDAYTPYQVEGMGEALGPGRSLIPWVAGIIGFTMAGLAYVFQWWMTAVDFPLNVGGRPLHPAPAFVPITFETGVLTTGTVAFFALIFACGMPRIADPLFDVEGFESASVDGYWVGVDRRAKGYDPDRIRALMEAMGAKRVSLVEDWQAEPSGGSDGSGEGEG